jgi:hypothetical protein
MASCHLSAFRYPSQVDKTLVIWDRALHTVHAEKGAVSPPVKTSPFSTRDSVQADDPTTF